MEFPSITIHDITIHHGDSNLIAPTLKERIDCIITDPPYELGFMGKKWDSSGIAFQVDFWKKMLDLLPPGGYLLAFGGTRTYHRMAVAIEDAGFEIRDSIHWTYGSGFPKNLNLSKAIYKHFGCERAVVGTMKTNTKMQGNNFSGEKEDLKGGIVEITQATHELAKQYEGYGTALKPSHEPIVVARKPLEGTLVQNILKYGTGAMDIDGGRININPEIDDPRLGGKGSWLSEKMAKQVYNGGYSGELIKSSDKGRWPANTIHDGSEPIIGMFPNTKSGEPTGVRKSGNNVYGDLGLGQEITGYGDEGSAARFFKDCHWDDEDYATDFLPIIYHAKASPSDRGKINNHPTVKPKSLMRYLVKMFCPKGGTVLDPFAGSGTTLLACVLENVKGIGIELGEGNNNLEIIQHRVKRAYNKELERQLTIF